MKQSVRTTVESDVFAALQAQADEEGVSLFIYLRNVLTEHASIPPPVTAEQWAGLRKWVAEDPARLALYDGPKNYKDPAARAVVHQWALDNGYTPTA